jgi:hypothetical protein
MNPSTNIIVPPVNIAIWKSPTNTPKYTKAFTVCPLYAAPRPGQTNDKNVAMNGEVCFLTNGTYEAWLR